MSLCVCGIIHTNLQNINDIVSLSFVIERIANNLSIGTTMGGNVSKYVYDNFWNNHDEYSFLFELTDSPLDNCAEELFVSESYPNLHPFSERMGRVQQLIKSILDINGVKKITLIINYLYFDDSSTINEESITVSEFYEKMRVIDDIYFSPTIRFEIIK